MTLLLSMPGGSEWLILILMFSMSLLVPALAIYFYLKSRSLGRELDRITQEKDLLLAKLMDKIG
ncbi:MAG: hypothetical protein JWQ27_379 [Ferruginibacter sp.]|nr:hypothetical protein [Ferruginibacter sp.]